MCVEKGLDVVHCAECAAGGLEVEGGEREIGEGGGLLGEAGVEAEEPVVGGDVGVEEGAGGVEVGGHDHEISAIKVGFGWMWILSRTMSKLNVNAFEFVPGRPFALPVTQAGPPQTISLNIGAPKPPPAQSPAPSHPGSHSSSPAPPVSKKIFSTEKSKSDTTAVAREVRSVADEAVLKDLFGDDGQCPSHLFLPSDP